MVLAKARGCRAETVPSWHQVGLLERSVTVWHMCNTHRMRSSGKGGIVPRTFESIMDRNVCVFPWPGRRAVSAQTNPQGGSCIHNELQVLYQRHCMNKHEQAPPHNPYCITALGKATLTLPGLMLSYQHTLSPEAQHACLYASALLVMLQQRL